MPADPQRSTEERCYCTHCGAALPSSPEAAGGEVNCPECQLPNEAAPEATSAQPKRSEHAEVLKFFCTFCNQKLSAPSLLAGKEFDCPTCSRSNTVPGEAPAAVAPRDLIKFFCTCCGQKLSVENRRIGQTIECPLCNGATVVPKEGVPLPKAPVKLIRPKELERKPAPRPPASTTPSARPSVPKPTAPKPIVPKPAVSLAPPSAAKRPPQQPKAATNGSPAKPMATNGGARPATTASARKTTANGKKTAIAPKKT